jgi:aldehyde dehydrogenase (NAD+)
MATTTDTDRRPQSPAAYPTLSPAAQALVGDPASFIGGVWEAGQSDLVATAVNPATGDVIAEVACASVDQGRRAVAAARSAFDGQWSKTTPQDRSRLLLELARLLDVHRAELEEIVVKEAGAPITLARAMQVAMPVENVRWAAGMALTGPPGGYERALPPNFRYPPSSSLLQLEPAGVVVGITGYNFPLNSIVWKLAPGLAAGCTLVIKPSPRTPLASIALFRLVQQAGFPDGVANLVIGEGDVGTAMVADPDVDLVLFTGSDRVGRQVMATAATSVTRVVMELGGKSASIILPGADLASAVAETMLRWCRMSGQACGATTRALVPRNRYADAVDAARQASPGLVAGDPWDTATVVGPLIRAEHRQFVEGHVEAAVLRGAVVEAGGGRPDGFPGGFFMNPVLVGNLGNDDPLCQTELFGPVGALVPYDTVDEAVAIANDSLYGLHASVHGPLEEALALAKRIRAGVVSVNGGGFMRPDAPWGGVKRSGFGREMGDAGFAEFFEVKHVQWSIQ